MARCVSLQHELEHVSMLLLHVPQTVVLHSQRRAFQAHVIIKACFSSTCFFDRIGPHAPNLGHFYMQSEL